ncbi:HU domain-containing protein [Spirosoma fluviale]|uniref:Sporulation related domain-containing protein n=1 Tax=Spirosoma fluviale TaxID=1597977 RepID=A0A286FFS6_9BACT|nr:SPOR domain-containing protein [Spirosoma fluviale]SOD82081.1 Sporulation related domain-containing protein [Spirosoma fluviale]
MAAVNEYLKKLLYQYDCVVVPELGAFLTHYQPAAFTEASGLYLPPRKRVAFNEALRFDDGILANYIMLHEPLTREGAQRHISQFVTNLRKQVETAGRFEIESIGTFTYNEENRLQFDPSFRHNFFGEAFGMSAVSTQLVNRKSQLEPALEAVPVTTLGPVLVREDDTTLTPYRPARTYWRAASIALLVGSLGVFSYFSVLNPGQPFQSSLSPADLIRIPTSLLDRFTTRPTQKPTSVAAPALAEEAKPETPVQNEPAPVATVPVVSETPAQSASAIVTPSETVNVSTEAAPVEKAVTNEVVAAAKPIRTEPYYTIIAGSFTSKRNALRLKRQLRKAGYADAFVIAPARKGQLYKVAAAGSADRNEAISNMAAIDQLAGIESWIYKN